MNINFKNLFLFTLIVLAVSFLTAAIGIGMKESILINVLIYLSSLFTDRPIVELDSLKDQK